MHEVIDTMIVDTDQDTSDQIIADTDLFQGFEEYFQQDNEQFFSMPTAEDDSDVEN